MDGKDFRLENHRNHCKFFFFLPFCRKKKTFWLFFRKALWPVGTTTRDFFNKGLHYVTAKAARMPGPRKRSGQNWIQASLFLFYAHPGLSPLAVKCQNVPCESGSLCTSRRGNVSFWAVFLFFPKGATPLGSVSGGDNSELIPVINANTRTHAPHLFMPANLVSATRRSPSAPPPPA